MTRRKRNDRPDVRVERRKLRGTNDRDAVGWTDRCVARLFEADEELASGEESGDDWAGAIERVDWRDAVD